MVCMNIIDGSMNGQGPGDQPQCGLCWLGDNPPQLSRDAIKHSALLLHALRLVIDGGRHPVDALAVALGHGMVEALGNRGLGEAKLAGQRRWRCAADRAA